MFKSVRKVEELEIRNAALEEKLRHANDIIKERNAEITELKKYEQKVDAKFREEKALAYKTMELEFKSKHMDEIQRIRSEYEDKNRRAMEENFSQLKEQLAKLHSEGNAQTKFTEEIALKMMDQFGKVAAPRVGYSDEAL